MVLPRVVMTRQVWCIGSHKKPWGVDEGGPVAFVGPLVSATVRVGPPSDMSESHHNEHFA